MKKLFIALSIFYSGALLMSCQAQQNTNPTSQIKNTNKIVGGGCDGCELMYIDMPQVILATDTSSGWFEQGQKLLLTGKVFQLDGKTPAANVIIYYWQTDNKGLYSSTPEMNEKANRHGHIRGWVKSDSSGNYNIFTIRPAPYPNQDMPAHIHLSIKEPDVENEYYTDEINFDDDKLLIPYFKKYPPENRAGSGVVRILLNDSLQIAEHNIILGLHIPNYPKSIKVNIASGLNIGEDQPSFTPFHAYGADKGTQTCPVCKYGRYHGILYFVGNHPNWNDIKKWLRFLDEENVKRKDVLKVYFIYGNQKDYQKSARQKLLEELGKDLELKKVALTFVPNFADVATEVNLNKINAAVPNTFIIYKNRNIVDKFVNLEPIPQNFNKITESLSRTEGKYFNLAEPEHH